MKERKKAVKAICKTGRLVYLRPINIETDLPIIQDHINREEVNQFLKVHGPLTMEQELAHFETQSKDPNVITFAIVDKKTGKFIGQVGLSEINWKTRMATTGSVIYFSKYWGKGYGADAKMLLLDFAFNRLNLHRINSSVIAFNERSAGCLKKCGYKEEGRRRQYHFRNGRYYDQIIFGILQSEFPKVSEKYGKDVVS